MDQYLDQSVSSTLPQTLEYLRNLFQEIAQGKCQLWVNPANNDPFAKVPLVEKSRVRVPIRHPRFDMRLAPYLVTLDLSQSSENDIFEESVEIAWHAWTKESLSAFCGQPISGWVATLVLPKALAAHWAQRCYLHRYQHFGKLLRFHDPGVREWLWSTLTSQQRDALLGPADSIIAIGRGHVIQRQIRPSGPSSATTFPDLVLDGEQWSQVESYATLHAAWLAWWNGSDSSKTYTPGWERSVFKALSHANQYGILDAQSRELFALHAMKFGSDFHSHQRMQPIWEKTLAGTFYGPALEERFACPVEQFTPNPCNR
jgi:hypothetical protein